MRHQVDQPPRLEKPHEESGDPDDESQKPRHDYEEDMLVLPDKNRVQCLLCGKDYVNKLKARKHIETIHKAAEDPSFQSKCQFCGKVFKHVIFKRNHVYKVHADFKKCPSE